MELDVGTLFLDVGTLFFGSPALCPVSSLKDELPPEMPAPLRAFLLASLWIILSLSRHRFFSSIGRLLFRTNALL